MTDYPWTAKFFIALAIVAGLASAFVGWSFRQHENAIINSLQAQVNQHQGELNMCRDLTNSIAYDYGNGISVKFCNDLCASQAIKRDVVITGTTTCICQSRQDSIARDGGHMEVVGVEVVVPRLKARSKQTLKYMECILGGIGLKGDPEQIFLPQHLEAVRRFTRNTPHVRWYLGLDIVDSYYVKQR